MTKKNKLKKTNKKLYLIGGIVLILLFLTIGTNLVLKRKTGNQNIESSKNKITSLSIDEAKKIVSSEKIGINLEDLVQLSPDIAKELSKFDGAINLSGLKQVSPDVVRELVGGNLRGIIFDGLSELSPDIANELIKSKRLEALSFYGLKSLDLETAKILSNFSGKIIVGNEETIELSAQVKKVLPKIVTDEVDGTLVFADIFFKNEITAYNYLPSDKLFQKVFGPGNNYHSFIDGREVWDNGTFLVFKERYCCTTGGDQISYLVKRNKNGSYSIILNNVGGAVIYDKIDCQKLKKDGVTSEVFDKYVNLVWKGHHYDFDKSAKEICPDL